MNNEPLDIMAPIEMPNGKTVWTKLGVYWPSQKRTEYVGTLSILTLPLGTSGPLELYLYPQREAPQKKYGRRSDRKGYRGSPPEEPGHEPDPNEYESPGGG